MIKPTVGRVVWFYPATLNLHQQPCAAIIACVLSDREINIGYMNHHGQWDAATRVPLLQEGDAEPAAAYCTWMPYQKGQAAKTDQLQQALVDASKQETIGDHA